MEQTSDEQFLAYLILGGFGLVVAQRLWSLKVKPWVTEQLGTVKVGGGDALAQIGSYKVETMDLIGVGVLFIPFLVLVWWLRRSVRSRRKERVEV